jgi:hypothetical protein
MRSYINIRSRLGEFVLDVGLFICVLYWKAVLVSALVIPPLAGIVLVLWVFGVL